MSAATRRTLGSVAVLALAFVLYVFLTPADDPAGSSDGTSIAVADLPREARATLALIEAGGPFPYDEDGRTFENREGLLPDEPRGTYAEYTVETPGEDDRGPRRIVCVDLDPCWWTLDHYASFRLIER